MWIGRNGGLDTLCHNCWFGCLQRLLKMFPGPSYLCFEDGVVWVWHFLVHFHAYGSPFYLATAQSQRFIAIGGMVVWAQCHSCKFACQERMLKTLVISHSQDEVVWLWHFLVNLHIYGLPFYLAMAQTLCLMAIGRGGGGALSIYIYILLWLLLLFP